VSVLTETQIRQLILEELNEAFRSPVLSEPIDPVDEAEVVRGPWAGSSGPESPEAADGLDPVRDDLERALVRAVQAAQAAGLSAEDAVVELQGVIDFLGGQRTLGL